MVLIEVVGRLLPIASIVHFVALCLVVSISIGWESPFVVVEYQTFVERIKASQSTFVQVFVGFNVLSHQRSIVVSRHNTTPCLSCFLEIAYVLVSYLEVIAHVCQATVVGTRPACRTMEIPIGSCFVVRTIENQMITEQSR